MAAGGAVCVLLVSAEAGPGEAKVSVVVIAVC